MKKTRNLSVLYAMALLQGMVFYAPVATLYRQARGVSLFEITLIESMSLALCLLLEVPWGWLADRMGYRRTMIGCCMPCPKQCSGRQTDSADFWPNGCCWRF